MPMASPVPVWSTRRHPEISHPDPASLAACQGLFPQGFSKRPLEFSQDRPLEGDTASDRCGLHIPTSLLPQALPPYLATCHRAWPYLSCDIIHHIHPASFLSPAGSDEFGLITDDHSALLTPRYQQAPSSPAPNSGLAVASGVH